MRDAVQQIIERFALVPHPESGYFREVFRSNIEVERLRGSAARATRRCGGTLIYFLLAGRDFSALHRLRGSDEIWQLYAGGPLELHTLDDAGHVCTRLSADLAAGEPAAIVPAGRWQAARLAPGAEFAFCGCTVAPGFDFADYDMPPARELIAEHPRHERLIRELTRG